MYARILTNALSEQLEQEYPGGNWLTQVCAENVS